MEIRVLILLQSWLHSFSESFDRNFHHLIEGLEAADDRLHVGDDLKSNF